MRGDAGVSGDDDFQDAVSRVQEDWANPPGRRNVSARTEFRRIYRRALSILGLEFLLVVAMLFAVPFASSSGAFPIAFLLWAIAFAALSIAYVVNWRCPVCGGYLGQGFWGIFSVSHCIRCGASLK